MPESRRGFLYGVAAYTLWGAFPLYFPLLEPASAFEILGHRIVWSFLVMAALVVATRRTAYFRRLLAGGRATVLLAAAACLVSVNWSTYIWAVNNAHVVEASLGYFINPLVSVVMGIAVLGESLRRTQWLAVGIAAVAVVVLAVDYGRPPWIAVTLALTFGTYGLAKKLANVGAVESLAFETMLVSPVAAAYLGWLAGQGRLDFVAGGPAHGLLLATTGVVTAVPLILFGAAATRIPLVTIGLLQYLAPVFQFALGVLWFGEAMPAGRWIGFVLVWIALAMFTTEAVRHHRRELRYAAESAAL